MLPPKRSGTRDLPPEIRCRCARDQSQRDSGARPCRPDLFAHGFPRRLAPRATSVRRNSLKVVGAPTPALAALGAVPQRGPKPEIATPTRACAAIPVMLEFAAAGTRVAASERQLRCVTRQEPLPRDPIDRGTGLRARHNGNRVERVGRWPCRTQIKRLLTGRAAQAPEAATAGRGLGLGLGGLASNTPLGGRRPLRHGPTRLEPSSEGLPPGLRRHLFSFSSTTPPSPTRWPALLKSGQRRRLFHASAPVAGSDAVERRLLRNGCSGFA